MNVLGLRSRLEGPPWTSPRPLSEWAGQLVCLEVGDGAVACAFVEQQLTASFFATRHWIYVLAEGEARGDQSLSEMAARSGLELEDLRSIESRIHFLPSRAELVLFDVQPLPTWEVTGDRRALFRAHVQSPGRFHASFLRNTEDLEPRQFLRVVGAIAEDCLARAAESDLTEREALTRGLAAVGLALEELELLPSTTDDTLESHSDREPESPPLASLARPR